MTGITGILLAAGNSTRFGNSNKLLHPLADGTPMVIASVRNLRAAVDRVIIVIRPDDHELSQLLLLEDVIIIKSPQSINGMGSSIASGVHASTESDGWLITLADMPYIQNSIMQKITQCLTKDMPIVRPAFQGRPGHPVGFKSTFRKDLLKLTGDEGAKKIINKYTSQIHFIEVSEPSVCMDIDTPQDLLSMAQD